jgi:hypothetical protein
MSRNQMLLGGACLLLVGLLVGYAVGSGGPDIEDIEAAVAERVDAAGAAQAERMAALETRLDELGGRLDGIEAKVTSGSETVQGVADRIGGDVADLGAELERLGSSLGGAIEQTARSHLEALQSGLSDLRAKLGALPAAVVPAPTAPAPEAAGDAATEGEPPAGQGVGETVLLSDGDLRVFVSRVEDDAAQLVINGTGARLAAGESRTVQAGGEDCRVTLVAIDRGHVVVAGGCGADLPEPEGAGAGSTVTLGDGAVRVFVSGVTDAGARIAVNGVETRTVPVGEAVEVRVGEENCRVSVESIDRGHVALGYACGS